MFAGFPNSTGTNPAMEAKFIEVDSFLDFYNSTYEYRNVAPLFPYRYGSFQIFEANKVTNQLTVNAFLNITSQDVAAIYPQFFYEAMFKTMFDDPDFEFSITTAPFPVFYAFKTRE